MLEKLFGAFVSEKETVVGKVDVSLAERLKANTDAHDATHEEIENEIREFMEKIKAAHKPDCDKFKKQRDEIWNEIYSELGIEGEDREEEYTIDRRTGVVTRTDLEPGPLLRRDEDESVGPIQ